MTVGPDPFEREDAAYVLGALGDEDRAEFEDHLRTCVRCSAQVAELAPLAGLLARLPGGAGSATALEGPPDTLLPGLLAGVRRDRARRHARVAAAGVAAAAALVAGTVAVTGQLRPAPETVATAPTESSSAPTAPPTAVPPTPLEGVPVALQGSPDVPVATELRLEDVAWGTRITIVCRYDGPTAAPDEVLQLIVVPAGSGRPQSVARWLPLPGRDARVIGATELDPQQIAEVQLLDGTGTVLLHGSP